MTDTLVTFNRTTKHSTASHIAEESMRIPGRLFPKSNSNLVHSRSDADKMSDTAMIFLAELPGCRSAVQ